MASPRIALATAIAAFHQDPDLAPLQAALQAAGAHCEMLAWDDPTVSWSRFDAVVLRSTWDYAERREAFLAWCWHVHEASRLLNPPDVVAWNTDKHYLAELAAAGVPVIPSTFLEPGHADAAAVRAALPACECVVKPSIGAGSRDARRFPLERHADAAAHAQALLDAGRSVLVQPYLAGVERAGESALVFIGGQFSHALRKGPLLSADGSATNALFAPEAISARPPSDSELSVARHALAAHRFGTLAYARVDLLPGNDGPRLLELELTEPSLFFIHAPAAAERLATTLLALLAQAAPAATVAAGGH